MDHTGVQLEGSYYKNCFLINKVFKAILKLGTGWLVVRLAETWVWHEKHRSPNILVQTFGRCEMKWSSVEQKYPTCCYTLFQQHSTSNNLFKRTKNNKINKQTTLASLSLQQRKWKTPFGLGREYNCFVRSQHEQWAVFEDTVHRTTHTRVSEAFDPLTN